jgi:hypothetical protein
MAYMPEFNPTGKYTGSYTSRSSATYDPSKYAAPTPIPAPPAYQMSIEKSPEQQYAYETAKRNVGEIRAGVAPELTHTMQNIRDLNTGQMKEYMAEARARGGAPEHKMNEMFGQQQRNIASAGWEKASQQRAALEGASQNLTGAASALQSGALGHGQLGLGAYQAQLGAWSAAQNANLAANQNAFNQQLALYSAQLRSPSMSMYGG